MRFKKASLLNDEGMRFKKDPSLLNDEGMRFKKASLLNDEGMRFKKLPARAFFLANENNNNGGDYNNRMVVRKSVLEGEGMRFKRDPSLLDDEGMRFKRLILVEKTNNHVDGEHEGGGDIDGGKYALLPTALESHHSSNNARNNNFHKTFSFDPLELLWFDRRTDKNNNRDILEGEGMRF